MHPNKTQVHKGLTQLNEHKSTFLNVVSFELKCLSVTAGRVGLLVGHSLQVFYCTFKTRFGQKHTSKEFKTVAVFQKLESYFGAYNLHSLQLKSNLHVGDLEHFTVFT